MPKSGKKSAYKVVSTPAAATQPIKNGKRDAEEIVQKKVVNGKKKQKIVNGGVPRDVEKNTKPQKKNKKQESNSESKEEEEKVQVSEGTSIYTQCSSWLKNRFCFSTTGWRL
ncbi:uncharacterized protein LOC110936545 isoform X1 [Helianthus annuus]|uniref:uncharacterized protein LOC110936545 isoform X1 n=1 Tax=Helianthus annuus TaxID=4232 RepID=UPI0016531D38|nr:uncharacterized protein LOC110936545 isoform X1 [Helianthus annuus]